MPSNVEIKAKLLDKEQTINRVKDLSQNEGQVLKQQDTFYNTPNGRLKLRRLEGAKLAQLICYDRPDMAGPKHSVYHVAFIEDPQQLDKVLSESLGVLGVVSKTRLLFLVGQTRVHIDTVQGLGDFLELEVVLSSDQLPSDGEAIAQDIMKKLGISQDSLITCAYMDLLLRQKHNS